MINTYSSNVHTTSSLIPQNEKEETLTTNVWIEIVSFPSLHTFVCFFINPDKAFGSKIHLPTGLFTFSGLSCV